MIRRIKSDVLTPSVRCVSANRPAAFTSAYTSSISSEAYGIASCATKSMLCLSRNDTEGTHGVSCMTSSTHLQARTLSTRSFCGMTVLPLWYRVSASVQTPTISVVCGYSFLACSRALAWP